MQFQGKLMNQTLENGQKPSFGPILAQIWYQKYFLWVLPLLDVIPCCKLYYAVSEKTNEPNLRKWQKA